MTKSDNFPRLFFMLHKNNNIMRHEIKQSKINNTKQLNPDNDVRLSALKQLRNDRTAINSELRRFLKLDNKTHGNVIKMPKIGKI